MALAWRTVSRLLIQLLVPLCKSSGLTSICTAFPWPQQLVQAPTPIRLARLNDAIR